MYYNRENPHGGDVYDKEIKLDFSANVNPYGAPASVLEAAREALKDVGKYPDPYCRKLVQGIAAAEKLPEKYIFCGNGASELIYAYCQAAKPETALLAAPTFGEYAEALMRAGSELCYCFLKKENAFAVDEELLSQIKEQKPEAVFLCNPNNPTGRSIRPDLLNQIVDLTKEEGIRLFVDECFYELSDGGFTLKDRLADHKGLFLLRAFTKSFGMAGLRLGYCLSADEELLMKMSECTPPWSISGPAQAAGEAALLEERFLTGSRRKIKEERLWLETRLKEAGLIVYPSEVNYIFFEGPADLQETLRTKGVEIRSCENYAGLGPGYFRIAVRTHEENEALIQAIAAIETKKDR